MDSVSYCTGTELFLEVSSACNPLGAGIISDKLHSSADIRLHKLGGFSRLAVVLLEEASGGSSGHLTHFHASNKESTLLNMVDNLASVHVGIRLNHSEGAFLCL